MNAPRRFGRISLRCPTENLEGDGLWERMRCHLHQEDTLTLSPDPGMSFPSAGVKRLPDTQNRVHLRATFPGLYGVEGHLPVALREAAQGDGLEARMLRGFLDIPGNRQAHLHYRAWQRARPTLTDGCDHHPLRTYLAALSGQGFPQGTVAPLMGGITAEPSVDALVARISRWLGRWCPDMPTRVRIAQFQPQWVPLSPPTCLGSSPGNQLGLDTHLSERVPDRSGPVNIIIGPLPMDQARSLSPGQHPGQALATDIHRGVGGDHRFVLTLEHISRPLPRLGRRGPILGMDTLWIRKRPVSPITHSWPDSTFMTPAQGIHTHENHDTSAASAS
ncbi:type VI secretion system baseplate subunit TssG [Ectothiorhodospira sp. 9905]|uniref:type VI secretion system baseplate subunit TssG n=2 Tax=unclassified Ectothiorhodospira TaxID=2684909 RepID=UPI00351D899F